MWFRLSAVLLAALVFALALAVRWRLCTDQVLLTDAADYYRAAQAGVASLYFESNSRHLPAVLKLALDPAGEAGPWQLMYEQGDNIALRHFHVPFSFYAAGLVHAWVPGNRPQRLAAAVVGALVAAAALLGLLWLRVPWLVALLAALVVALDTRFVLASTDFSPHPYFLLWALLALFSAAQALQTKSRPAAIALVVTLTLAGLSLELFPQLLVVLAAVAVAWHRAQLAVLGQWLTTRPGLLALASSAALPVLLWPGGLLAGALPLSYGVFFYQAATRQSSYYGPLTPAVLYRNLIAGHELLCLLLLGVVAGAAWLWRQGRRDTAVTLFAAYAVLGLVLGLGHRFRLATYVAEALTFAPAGFALAVAAVARSRARARAVLAAGSLLLVLAAVQEARATWALTPEDNAIGESILAIRRRVPPRSTVFTNGNVPAYRLYLPEYQWAWPGSRAATQSRGRGADDYLVVVEEFLNEQQARTLRQYYVRAAGPFVGRRGRYTLGLWAKQGVLVLP